MRNHKSFLNNLWYKFLLFVSNSLGIQEKLHFSQNVWDADRPTSTQLRLSETGQALQNFFSFFFLNHAHTEVNCVAGKTSRMTGFFYKVSHCLGVFVYFFHWINICYYKEMKSQFCRDNKPCLSVPPTIAHHVRINTWGRQLSEEAARFSVRSL